MADPIEQFERDCAAAGVQPHVAVRAGGLDVSIWWKWRAGKVSPTLRSLGMARDGLAKLSSEKAA